jgi:truncated hemoglobin YjbI
LEKNYRLATSYPEVLSSTQTFTCCKEHFDRWMEIFTSTVDTLFRVYCRGAKMRAKNMAEMFN